jgi:hypothetical protein
VAITTRRSNGTAPDAGDLADRIGQLERIQTITLRILARAAVRVSPGYGSAPFARILTDELRAATPEEAAAVEAWLTAHQGT